MDFFLRIFSLLSRYLALNICRGVDVIRIRFYAHHTIGCECAFVVAYIEYLGIEYRFGILIGIAIKSHRHTHTDAYTITTY